MIDLKQKRTDARMTQEQLSKKSGIKRTTIAMIETGKNHPAIPTAKALAATLGFDWAEFYDEEGEESVTNSTGSCITFTG